MVYGNDDVVCQINDVMLILNQSNMKVSAIQNLINTLPKVSPKSKLTSKLEEDLAQYYETYKETLADVYSATGKIEKFVHKCQLSQIPKFAKAKKSTRKATTSETESKTLPSISTISATELDSSFTENTLIISETQGKIILPYTLKEVNRIWFTNQKTYSSYKDVIDKLYTLPIGNYKPSSVARFREAYKLASKSNGSSKLKSLSLASELFMNYNLHPAIITACKSVDELDVYLACLEDNTLQDFKFFDIKYEIPPIAVNT